MGSLIERAKTGRLLRIRTFTSLGGSGSHIIKICDWDNSIPGKWRKFIKAVAVRKF